MVGLDVVRASNAALVKSQPLVAVFVGGTSGIGEYTVRALAAAHAGHGKGLRVYVVGRNGEAAANIVRDCLKVCPEAHFKFVKAGDLSLISDVDGLCTAIRREIRYDESRSDGTPRIDFMVMSHAVVKFEGRRETREGLDEDMSLLYYSRMRLVTQLLPLLLASALPAHVVSVYAAGKEGKYFPDDLSLRDPKVYSFLNARSHVIFMKTSFMETLAQKHPGKLSLVHAFPGMVMTKSYTSPGLPIWFKLAWKVSAPFARPFSIPQFEAGERTLFLASPRFPARPDTEGGMASGSLGSTATAVATGTDGNIGSGAYAVGWDGATVEKSKAYKNVPESDLAGKVWDHTTQAFADIEAGRGFSG